MNCDGIREFLEEYALGTLDDITAYRVREHIGQCKECSAILADYETMLADIPALTMTADTHPSEHVKERLLLRLDEKNKTIQQDANGSTSDKQPVRLLIPFQRLAGIVLFIGFVALLGWNIYLGQQLGELQTTLQEQGHHTELIFEVVGNNAEQVLLLPVRPLETEFTRPPYGKVFTRDGLPYIVAMAGRMPSPPPGQVYAVWLFNGNQAQRLGTLEIDSMGFGSLVYDAEREGIAYERAEIILQPENSPDATSGETIVAWEQN